MRLSLSLDQKKAIERYIPVMLFIMMYEVVLTFESAVALLLSVTIQMNASKQCFLKILFITLYRGVLPFEPMDKIPYGDHSNKSCLT